MQTELQKIVCDKTYSLAVYYVQPFDKLIGKHIEANGHKVQVEKGNLDRHGNFTATADLILSHTGEAEAFITYNYGNYIPPGRKDQLVKSNQTPTIIKPL